MFISHGFRDSYVGYLLTDSSVKKHSCNINFDPNKFDKNESLLDLPGFGVVLKQFFFYFMFIERKL